MATRVYHNVQALRGVAALMVASGHAAFFHLFVLDYNVFSVSSSGVDIFFAISGFIICGTAIQHEAVPWRFLVKRVTRIFPVYWIVLAVCAVASLWVTTGFDNMPQSPAVDYILLTTLVNSFVPQAWSLAYEIYFYAWVSVVLLIAPRRFWPTIGILLLCQVCSIAYTLLRDGNPEAYVYTSWLVLEFGFGCGVAYLCNRGYHRFGGLTFFFGVICFIIGSVWMNQDNGLLPDLSRVETFGIGGAAILYTLVSIELRNGFILPKLLQRLGDASYSIYLWHLIIIKMFIKIIPAETFMTVLTRNTYGLVIMLVILGVSFTSYHFIEAPTVRMVNRWLGARLRTSPTTPIVIASPVRPLPLAASSVDRGFTDQARDI
jgi:peptidoglycan/LPS O-acetylase OafA/YrhL